MRQFIVLCLLAVCIPSESFGEGIFGLKKGMTLDEIKELDFGRIEQNEDEPIAFFVEQPKKPQGTKYVIFVVIPEMGLMKVRFYWTIEVNSYGDELKRKFDDLQSVLSKKYGKGEKVDYLKSDSIWKDPKYYMKTLERNERELYWYSTDIPDPNELELEAVVIETGVNSNLFLPRGLYEGFIYLNYEFRGFSDYWYREDSQF